MTDQLKPMTSGEALKKNFIKPGSEKHVMLLETGYGITLADAAQIVSEWEKDHKAWPLEEVKKARALLEAAKATPKVIDTEPGWKRERTG